jgi:hypothetical protein
MLRPRAYRGGLEGFWGSTARRSARQTMPEGSRDVVATGVRDGEGCVAHAAFQRPSVFMWPIFASIAL